mgnify:FL=1
MSYITPDSEIRLGTIAGLDNTYRDSFQFDTDADQFTYFWNRLSTQLTAQSYKRITANSIKVQLPFATAGQYNYMMFRNQAYEDVWFYAFITRAVFISEEVTELFFEIDVLQSYYWAYTLMPSFIEREHVEDDSIGLHTAAEPIDIGEIRCVEVHESDYFDDYSIILAAAQLPGG